MGFGRGTQARADHFAHLVDVAQTKQRKGGGYSVGFQRAPVVAEDGEVAFQSGGGSATRAHGDKIGGEVDGADFMHEDEAKELFEIGRHGVGEIEGAVLCIACAAAVERGVGGHEAEAHHPRPEGARTVIARHRLQIAGGNVVHIAVAGVDIGVGERIGHASEDVLVGIEVVAVENAHHFARGASNTFVHCIVESAIGFAAPVKALAELGGKLANDVGSVVGRSTVGHNDFKVGVGLGKNRAKGVGEGGTTVISGRDNGDFHGRDAAGVRRQRRGIKGKRMSMRNFIFAHNE